MSAVIALPDDGTKHRLACGKQAFAEADYWLALQYFGALVRDDEDCLLAWVWVQKCQEAVGWDRAAARAGEQVSRLRR